jgi:carbamoyl-phosphate synthase/aspartate carbamoyltransferase/dihydroorotase
MIGADYEINIEPEKFTGVKVPQFSFNRLANADNRLGVEMLSTGEVACFGENYQEAYLKALSATGFKIKNNCNVLVSIGTYQEKVELVKHIEMLSNNGFTLFGTEGTAKFYMDSNINITCLQNEDIYDKIKEGFFGLVINTSIPNKISKNTKTHGYFIRRLSIDYGIDILINIKCTKLYIESVVEYYNKFKTIGDADVHTSNRYVKLPMLIDMHVHVREPGDEHKETWDTCSKAALKGGNGLICAMPNTKPSCTNIDVYNMVNKLAKEKSVCDYMIFMGADGENYTDLDAMNSRVCAIKFYLNETFSTLKINNISVLRQYFIHCPENMLMCFHAEVEMVGVVLYLASIYKKRVHICHISKKEEVEMIRDAKENGIEATCEVTPHHLFFDEEMAANLPENFRTVKPVLNDPEDRQAIWDNMDIIDCFATDHAPHLKSEKQDCGCPGFTGLETALPLLLNAVNEGKLTIDDIVNKYHHNPKRILRLDDNYGQNSYVEVNMDREYTICDEYLVTKAGWSPFSGVKIKGSIERFVFNGECVYNNGLSENLSLGQNVNIYKNNYLDTGTLGASNSGNLSPTDNVDNVNNQSNTSRLSCDLENINGIKDESERSLSLGHRLYIKEDNGAQPITSVIDVSQFDRDNLRSLFKNATIIKQNIKKFGKLDILSGKTVGLYFDEPSSRTYGSFCVAVQKMGGDVLALNASGSSTKKGESLYDTLKCFEAYCDLVVVRTKIKGTFTQDLQNKIKIPIINAGDGEGEHPTQALLDVFTIREERGTVNKLNVSIVGDLKNGRTVHSLVRLLKNYQISFNFVSVPELGLDESTKLYLNENDINYSTYNSINDVIETTDVLYMTRIQSERFDNSILDHTFIENNLYLTQEIMTNAKQNMIIMHPLPRNNEINPNIDNDPRAAYFRQMENGLYVRMALLQLLL